MPTPQITYIHQAAFEDGSFLTQNYSLRTQLCNVGDSFMTTFSNQQMCNAPDVIDEAYITVEAAYFDSSNYSYEVSATLNGSEYTLDTNYDPSFSFPSGTTLTFTKTFSDHPLRLVKCVDFANDSNCIDSAYIFDELTATINSGETFRYYCTSHPLEMGGYITAYD